VSTRDAHRKRELRDVLDLRPAHRCRAFGSGPERDHVRRVHAIVLDRFLEHEET